jgi:hypothetical protein
MAQEVYLWLVMLSYQHAYSPRHLHAACCACLEMVLVSALDHVERAGGASALLAPPFGMLS